MYKGFFITGTGTDIGKTYVTALILKKLHQAGKKAAYYKAAISGNARQADGSLIPGDAAYVQKISGIPQPLAEMCPYVYEKEYSPHLAAQIEGNPVRLDVVQAGFATLTKKYDTIIAEGSGGILCPIRWDEEKLMLTDVIRALRLPCLMVADAGLGTINSVVLTAFYMRQHNIPVKGVIFNRFRPGHPLHENNLKMCQELTGIPVITCVQEGDRELSFTAPALIKLLEERTEIL